MADNGYLFIGQNMLYGGTSMYWTINHIPENQRIELPVFEDIQSGMATGMALEGLKVCSVYPRWDFMLLALNQIVSHLDKAKEMSDGQFNPKVIIRVAVGSSKPLMPGPQHSNDYTEALKKMVTNIDIYELKKAEDVYPAYIQAMGGNRSAVLVEYPDIYNQEMTDEFIKARAERK
jgi:pyruvate/2-oxoglutarate/acetoin dehydrogenase E1 component